MSWVGTSQGGSSAPPAPPDLEDIVDEELLKQLWQQAEDYGERRKIRARMYKLREQRLREMVQNDEESLGALVTTEEGDNQGTYERSETEMSISSEQPARKSSNIEVTMRMTGGSAITDNVSLQNVRLGGITMRGVDSPTQGEASPKQLSDEEIIDERIKEVSKDRTTRYHKILDDYNKKDADDAVVSLTKSTYSIQSDALAGDSYQSMKHKEVRDSISPTRYGRKTPTYDSDGKFPSEDEAIFKKESETVIKALNVGRKNGRLDKAASKNQPSDPLQKAKRGNDKKASSDSDSSSSRPSSTSPTRRNQTTPSMKTASRATASTQAKNPPGKKANARVTTTKKSKMDEIAEQMDASLKNEYSKLDSYLSGAIDPDDELIMEEEEEAIDNSGNIVKMVVQTRRKKDGTEYSSRRVARSTKIVEKESDIDEILIGNPDHDVISRNIEEKEEKDGSKIKIITEVRRRPDGIEYTTKNVLKTSKIFDYDHPEEISYSEEDELIESKEDQETDEQGTTIRTVTETRRKSDGTEYTTKKVFKTLKVVSQITPSDDDEIIDSKESEEIQEDGTVIKTVIEKRRTKNGEEYTHRQIYRTRRMTLSGIELQKGLPMMNNDDKVIDKKEKEELDEHGKKVKVVTETRRRPDGSTYTFDYILRSFKTTESDLEKMPIKTSSTAGITVNIDDKLIKEDVKEELQKDGSTIKTIIERRRAKDGTEYLRHRIMKIPKLPEPKLQVGSLDDEILEGDVKEKVLEDGTHCRSITERRRSSTTGMQYTLRRMSKVYHQQPIQQVQSDEIIDENVTEEETSDGILIKTVIRRYQRPDATVYTTHDVQRVYTTPVPVIIDQSQDDKLIDRSYDERETSDGFIIKTIMETRCRADGLHYTVERVEKISKYGPEIEVSFKGDSLSGGGPGDTVVSREEHEEPNEDGIIIKTILEIRRRQDGTEYTNKTTIRSTEVLVPEHETSYVVIKPDDDHGFMPSLDDKILYTRQREEVDEKGNIVKVVIETRESKSTGEKYNLTKKVHTTDVLVTEQGEKILSKKPKATQKPKPLKPKATRPDSDQEEVPYGSVSALKNRFSSPKKTETSTAKININRTNTASKKMFFEEAATKSAAGMPTKSSPLRTEPKVPLSDYRTAPKQSPITTDSTKPSKDVGSDRKEPQSGREFPKKLEPLSPTKATDDKPQFRDKAKEHKKTPEKGRTESSKAPSNKSPQTSSDEKTPKTRKFSPDSSSDEKTKTPRVRKSTPESSSDEKSKTSSKTPLASRGSFKDSPSRRSPTEKQARSISPTKYANQPKRSRSPIQSDNRTIREVTPSGGRQCCKRVSEALEKAALPKQTPTKTRKIPDEKPKVNGTTKRMVTKFSESPKLKKEAPEITPKAELRKRPDSLKSSPRTPDQSSPKAADKKDYPRQPQKSQNLTTGHRNNSSYLSSPREPIVSLPQTPMTEDLKPYPNDADSPYIEDVTTEPNLPSHSVHRPSLVREPSESYGPVSTEPTYVKNLPKKGEQPTKEDKPDQRIARKKPIDKPLFEKAPSLSEELSMSSNEKSTRDTTRRSDKKVKSSTISSGDEESKSTEKVRPYQRKLSDKSSPVRSQERKKSPSVDSETRPSLDLSSRNLKDWEKSVISQIVPNGKTRETNIDSPRKSSLESRDTVSLKRSIFEGPSRENKDDFKTKKPDKPTTTTPKERIPVNEPLCVKRHSFKLGENGEHSDEEHSVDSLMDDVNLTSTKLVMKTMSPEPKKSDIMTRKATQMQDAPRQKKPDRDSLSPFRERSTSPLSKKSLSPHPRSKESSPAPFSKEGSPNQFLTGRPVDLGVNPNKIKKLERSNSNKKSYEDFEEKTSQLTHFIKEVETITEISVLEKMLEKLHSYEERRIVRGRIRSLRKPLSTQPSSKDRFSSSKFIASPQVHSKTPTKGDLQKTSAFTEYKPSTKKLSETIVDRSPESFKTNRTTNITSRNVTTEKDTGKYVSTREKINLKETHISSDNEKEENYIDFVTERNLKNKQSQPIQEKPAKKSSFEWNPRKHSTEENRITRKVSTEEKQRKVSSETEVIEKSTRKTSFERKTYKVTRKDSSEIVPRMTSREKRPSDGELRKSTLVKDQTSSEDDTTRTSKYEHREDSIIKREARKLSIEKEQRTSSSERETRRLSTQSENKKVSQVTSRKQRIGSVKSSDDSDKEKSTFKTPKTKSDAIPKRTSPVGSSLQPNVSPSSIKETRTTVLHSTYSEPLRHQRTPSKVANQSQTDVEKIISPYGVGPTDENGVPLFGLKALKKRKQTKETEVLKQEELEKPEEFEPKDSQGKPLFGIKAIRKSPPESTTYTATHVTKEATSVDAVLESASVITEKHNLSTGVVTQQATHARESSPLLRQSVDDSTKRTTESEEEEIMSKAVNLKDIIKLHESKASEPVEPRSVSPQKPKQKLRGSFEPTVETTESRTHRTWDLETDLSTRSEAVENIIAKHETLTKKESATLTQKPEKKLTGILKKTSTSSVPPTKITDEEMTSPDEQEYIKTKKASREKTPQPSQVSDDETPKEIKRKTSYTEIVLSPALPPEGEVIKKVRTDKKRSTKTETQKTSADIIKTTSEKESSSESSSSSSSSSDSSGTRKKSKKKKDEKNKHKEKTSKMVKKVKDKTQESLLKIKKAKNDIANHEGMKVAKVKTKQSDKAPVHPTRSPKSTRKYERACAVLHKEREEHATIAIEENKALHTKKHSGVHKKDRKLEALEDTDKSVKIRKAPKEKRSPVPKQKVSVSLSKKISDDESSRRKNSYDKTLKEEPKSLEKRKPLKKASPTLPGSTKDKVIITKNHISSKETSISSKKEKTTKTKVKSDSIEDSKIIKKKLTKSSDRKQSPKSETSKEANKYLPSPKKGRPTTQPVTPVMVNQEIKKSPKRSLPSEQKPIGFKKEDKPKRTRASPTSETFTSVDPKQEEKRTTNQKDQPDEKSTRIHKDKVPLRKIERDTYLSSPQRDEMSLTTEKDTHKASIDHIDSEKSANVIILEEEKIEKRRSLVRDNSSKVETSHGKPDDVEPRPRKEESPPEEKISVSELSKPSAPRKISDVVKVVKSEKDHPTLYNDEVHKEKEVLDSQQTATIRTIDERESETEVLKINTTIEKNLKQSKFDTNLLSDENISSLEQPLGRLTSSPKVKQGESFTPETSIEKRKIEKVKPTTKLQQDTKLTEGRQTKVESTKVNTQSHFTTDSKEISKTKDFPGDTDTVDDKPLKKIKVSKPQESTAAKRTFKTSQESISKIKENKETKVKRKDAEITSHKKTSDFIQEAKRKDQISTTTTLSEERITKPKKQPFITDVRIKESDLREKKLAIHKSVASEEREKRRSLTAKNYSSRLSGSPEPDDLNKRFRKLSNKGKGSVENLERISDSQLRMKQNRTFSLQSLSGASTTSSVPSYMRPKGEGSRKRQVTPERDPQELEDILLNSYRYTRCTKRISKPPVTYDYVYTVHKGDDAAGGGAGSYSIYFGPRDQSPTKESTHFLDASLHATERTGTVEDHSETVYKAQDFRRSREDSSYTKEFYDDVYYIDDFTSEEQRKTDNNVTTTQDEYEKIIRKYSDAQSHFDLTRRENISKNEGTSQIVSPIYSSVEIISDDATLKETTYPEIRQHYLDTVKSIDRTSRVESEEKHVETSFEMKEENQSQTIEKDEFYVDGTKIDSRALIKTEKDISGFDLQKPEILISKDSSEFTTINKGSSLLTDEKKYLDKVTTDSSKTSSQLSSKAASSSAFKDLESTSKYSKEELQQKYNYQVENKMADYYKTDSFKKESSKMDIQPGTTSAKQKESVDKKYLMDYDFNKVYADKISKQLKTQSDSEFEQDFRKETSQMSSYEELKKIQESRKSNLESAQTFSEKQRASYETESASHYSSQKRQSQVSSDDSYYVTFDGRIVPSSKPSTAATKGESNELQKSPHLNVQTQETKEIETLRGAESSLKIESSSSATLAHDSSSFSSVQRSSSGRRIRGYESVEPSYQEELLQEREDKAAPPDAPDMPATSRSFLEDKSKVSGISDVLTRMGATQAVDHESRVTSDDQAKSLLNKFLGAQVLMTGVESMMNQSGSQSGFDGQMTVTKSATGSKMSSVTKDGHTTEHRSHFSTGPQSFNVKSSSVQQSSSPIIKGVNIDEVTDSFELNQLLDSCEEYDERRRIRMRLKALMADTNILEDELKGHGSSHSSSKRAAGISRAANLGSKGVNSLSSEVSSTRTSEIRGTSQGISQKTSYSKTSSIQSKTESPFNKFKQLDAQHPKYSTSGSKPANSGPLFQLSANLNRSASGVKDMILMWCQCRTRDYKGVKIENFSTSWNDGLAFCALIHHFFPDSFNFDSLDPKNRRYNFSLAFRVADEKAGVYPLLDVDDMVMMQKPDWKCVFTYVQSLYKRLKDE